MIVKWRWWNPHSAVKTRQKYLRDSADTHGIGKEMWIILNSVLQLSSCSVVLFYRAGITCLFNDPGVKSELWVWHFSPETHRQMIPNSDLVQAYIQVLSWWDHGPHLNSDQSKLVPALLIGWQIHTWLSHWWHYRGCGYLSPDITAGAFPAVYFPSWCQKGTPWLNV